MKSSIKGSLKKGIVTRSMLQLGIVPGGEFEQLGRELKGIVDRRFARSFHIREVDAGSCNACESEIISATNPLYDLQRFGVDFVASPRHADALLVTGPVSKNMELALRRTYEAMPAPKYVIAFGACAADGGPFRGSYYTCAGAQTILPVDAVIPGCPPRPADLIRALLALLKKG